MQDTRFDLAGSVVYWALGDGTNYETLSTFLSGLGFGQYTPEKMTEYASLRQALEEEFPKDTVFPVKDAKNTFEVVRIKKDSYDKRNDYEHVATAWVNEDGTLDADRTYNMDMYAVRDKFAQLRNTVPFSNVSRALVKIVQHLGGTTLRENGGVYWVPTAMWDRWSDVVKAVEVCGSRNRIFNLRAVYDEYSLTAIREALTNEIKREAENIDKALSAPEATESSMTRAIHNAQRLRDKIIAYESAFNVTLGDLKTLLDDATTIEAKAVIMESVKQTQAEMAETN